MKRSFNPWLLVMLIVLGIFVFSQFTNRSSSTEILYSDFTNLVNQGAVESITIERSNGRIQGQLKQAETVGDKTVKNFSTTTLLNDTLLTDLQAKVGNIEIRNPPQWIGFAISILPIIILIGFFWFIFILRDSQFFSIVLCNSSHFGEWTAFSSFFWLMVAKE